MIKQDRSDKSSSIDLRPLHQALGGRRGHQALGGKQGHQGETDLKKSSSTGLRLLFLVDHLGENLQQQPTPPHCRWIRLTLFALAPPQS